MKKVILDRSNMDRLPDEVIGHILSFLPTTKSFVQTSVLSKQWRFLWTRVPVLGFILFDDDKKITTMDDEILNSWIDTTLFARNVCNIVIRLNHQLMLPPHLFSCKTIVDLCIIDSGVIPTHEQYGFACLPALKKLRLVNVVFGSEDSLTYLIFGSPLLEELIIDRMKLNYCAHPSKRKLSSFLMKHIIATKNNFSLRYLYLRVDTPVYMSMFPLGTLIEANIDLSEAHDYDPSHFVNFIRNLPRNLKGLTLSIPPMKVNSVFPYGYQEFPRLKKLDLHADWRFIPKILETDHHLRVLTIRRSRDNHNTQLWTEPRIWAPNYLEDCLEMLNLVDFEWSAEQEFEMVRYILTRANVLKMVKIIYTELYEEVDWTRKLEVLNKLGEIETPSPYIRFKLF